jgi:hypothetical protein
MRQLFSMQTMRDVKKFISMHENDDGMEEEQFSPFSDNALMICMV